MKNINVGIASLTISNKFKESYLNDKLIDESLKITQDFLDVMKNSPLLQLEFKVFNNINGKHIENDIIASRYIDNNIKLFEIYTLQEIEKEHEKLIPFINENVTPYNESKILLFDAIETLIKESVKCPDEIDVDSVHDAFTLVLNHIKTPPKQNIENDNYENISEDVIDLAIDKFNKKYKTLEDDSKNLLQQIIMADEIEKKTLLETYKRDTIAILEKINGENEKENIGKAIQKINEMVYEKDTVDNYIISLHELKKELL